LGKIIAIRGREVLDSRGNPTVQAEVFSEHGFGRATTPSGASTGRHEALELRDGGARYRGMGVLKAISYVNNEIANLLRGQDVCDQKWIDAELCLADGTENKSRLGANTTTAVSLAVAQCAASERGVELYRYLCGREPHPKIPAPMMNFINGGKHAENGVAMQEFMVYPLRFGSFSEALRASSETYHALRGIIQKKYGKIALGLGDEGGFTPPCKSTSDALELLMWAIGECGYQGKMALAIDAAASSFYNAKTGKYKLDGRNLSPGELADKYVMLTKKYPIVSIEDPFEEDSFAYFAKLRRKLFGRVQLVGDDLLVTNVSRLRRAIRQKSVSALLLKVNQVGTLSEALEAASICRENGMGVVVSHRSGDTEDPFISDIAVGIGCGQIKAGSLARAERTAKYNRLLRIEENLTCHFIGDSGVRR